MISATPDACLPTSVTSPSFHITGMGVGPHDANAIFPYKGVWHAMHQANWTDWAHLTSPDLVHWTRTPSALSPNGDWDGTLSMLDGKPIIFFDCYSVEDCNGSFVPPARRQRQRSVGLPLDPPIVGVARPSDPDDATLLSWKKDPRNPIALHQSDGTPVTRGFAGPSNLWRTPAGALTFAMQLGGSIARFESDEASLHNWTLADPAFYAHGGHGGHGASGLAFFELPSAGGAADAGPYTHWLGNLWADGTSAGTQYVVLGRYGADGTFANVSAPQPIESSQVVVFGTMQCTDGRCIHLAWFNVGGSCLTVPRELTYAYSAATGEGRMLALPVKEIETLRNASLGVRTAITVDAAHPLAAFDTTSTTFDLEAELTLPVNGSATVALLAASPSVAEVLLTINATTLPGYTTYSVSAEVPFATTATYNTTLAFNMSGGEATLPLRVVADRTLVEVFVGGGRGVVSTPVLEPGKSPDNGGVFFSAPAAPYTVASASAWEMGCGWAP